MANMRRISVQRGFKTLTELSRKEELPRGMREYGSGVPEVPIDNGAGPGKIDAKFFVLLTIRTLSRQESCGTFPRGSVPLRRTLVRRVRLFPALLLLPALSAWAQQPSAAPFSSSALVAARPLWRRRAIRANGFRLLHAVLRTGDRRQCGPPGPRRRNRHAARPHRQPARRSQLLQL